MSSQSKQYGIIVGVDGSPASDSAVEWAARDAVVRGTSLTLVRVENPAAPTWSQAPALEELKGWQQAEGRRMLENASKIAQGAVNDSAHIHVDGELLFSATVPTLVDLSRHAELVVVGTDGRGALSRGLLGSVSSGLVRHAHCPVAVIHEDGQTRSSAADPVVVGIDGSPTSERAIAIAFDEASRRHVHLVALHAWSDEERIPLPGVNWSAVEEEEQRLLTEALAGWQERYPDVKVTKRLVCERPARALVRECESAQLVVVGSHGSNALTRTLLGSVSNALVQSVRRPVIVARPS